ncbi:MAG: hypothetical protein RMJ19_02420 [Gemmatales bacterium]|nr:hypothetical protein [Gemmatales bacterium]MCS7159302.1 hypothetical protein [Gemmatales bacterium]MDW8174502.1 hypothetical protein [Gemmatales bacterium]MDW8222953.1 hypothetical protein [Gemmatales bacterium]
MAGNVIFEVKERETALGQLYTGQLVTSAWLSPTVLADPVLRAPFEEALHRQLLPVGLSGRMPLWLAGGLVAWLVRSACPPPSIWVYEPRLANYIPVWPTAVCRAWLEGLQRGPQLPSEYLQGPVAQYLPQNADHAFPDIRWPVPAEALTVRSTPQERLSLFSIVEVESTLKRLLAEMSTPMLVLDGPMPLWLAAALAGNLASRRNLEVLALHAPLEGGFVVILDNPRVPIGAVIPQRQPTLVGIVGDPNHGKSVLSWKLYWQLQQRHGFRVYRLDADAYSPTPGWSLNPLASPLRDEFKRIRGPWSEQDHENLATALRNLRRSVLDLVLVDLPGGDHSQQPPVRIPPGREKIFHALDKFILVCCNGSCRNYPKCRQGWYDTLKNLALDRALIAEVISVLDMGEEMPRRVHTVQSSMGQEDSSPPSLPCWRVAKLRRELVRETTKAIEDLAQFVYMLTQPRR